MNNDEKKTALMMIFAALMGGARVEVVRHASEDMTPEDCAACPARNDCPDCKKKKEEEADDSINEEDRAALRRMGIKA
jgi:hypothetical protein